MIIMIHIISHFENIRRFIWKLVLNLVLLHPKYKNYGFKREIS